MQALPQPVTLDQLPVDDAVLAARGDRRAFERLYRDHVARVFALCVRMVGERARAEELTQDVFVRAWEKLEQFRGNSAFGTWLHRLAVNVVLNDRQSEKRRRDRRDDGVDAMDALSHTEARPLALPGLAIDLEAAIAALPLGASRAIPTRRLPRCSASPLEAARRSSTAPGCC